MCLSICYIEDATPKIIQFTDPLAQLPIVSDLKEISWGRRIGEHGHLPLGGWLNAADIEAGHYDKFFPRRCDIPALKFMEQNIEGQTRWFAITNGNRIQGIVLRYQNEERIYIMTVTTQITNNPYTRWPLLVYH